MPPQREDEPRRGGGDVKEYATIHVDQFPDIEPLERTSTLRRESFIAEFYQSRGPPQIVILVILLALGFGSTIGVVSACSVVVVVVVGGGHEEDVPPHIRSWIRTATTSLNVDQTIRERRTCKTQAHRPFILFS
jgi:hypothetical protein